MYIEEISHKKYKNKPTEQHCFCEGAYCVLEEIEKTIKEHPIYSTTTVLEIKKKVEELYGEHIINARKTELDRGKGIIKHFWEKY